MRRIRQCAAGLATHIALGVQAPQAHAASVSFGLRIGDRYDGPRIGYVRNPDLMLVPGTNVYYMSTSDYDLYRFGGYYYTYYDGGWYRATRSSGPYAFISYQSVPRQVRYVPSDYRSWRTARGYQYGNYRSGRWYRNRDWQNHQRTERDMRSRHYRDYDNNNGNNNDNNNYDNNRYRRN